MAGFTIPRAFVSMDPWSGTLLVGMPRGVTLPDGRDVGGYSLRKYADEREKTDWRGEEGIRVTLDDGFPARLQRGRGDDVEAVFVDASVLADAVKTRLDSALRAAEDFRARERSYEEALSAYQKQLSGQKITTATASGAANERARAGRRLPSLLDRVLPLPDLARRLGGRKTFA